MGLNLNSKYKSYTKIINQPFKCSKVFECFTLCIYSIIYCRIGNYKGIQIIKDYCMLVPTSSLLLSDISFDVKNVYDYNKINFK